MSELAPWWLPMLTQKEVELAAGDGFREPLPEPEIVPRQLGWRLFKVDNGLLYPIFHHKDHAWGPGINTFDACGSTVPSHPNEKCRCGFYGFWNIEQACEQWGNEHPECILGAVAYSGIIIPHIDGFRAEKAEILATVWPTVEPLFKPDDRYGIETFEFDHKPMVYDGKFYPEPSGFLEIQEWVEKQEHLTFGIPDKVRRDAGHLISGVGPIPGVRRGSHFIPAGTPGFSLPPGVPQSFSGTGLGVGKLYAVSEPGTPQETRTLIGDITQLDYQSASGQYSSPNTLQGPVAQKPQFGFRVELRNMAPFFGGLQLHNPNHFEFDLGPQCLQSLGILPPDRLLRRGLIVRRDYRVDPRGGAEGFLEIDILP